MIKNKCVAGKCTSEVRGSKDCDYRITGGSQTCKMYVKGFCVNKEAVNDRNIRFGISKETISELNELRDSLDRLMDAVCKSPYGENTLKAEMKDIVEIQEKFKTYPNDASREESYRCPYGEDIKIKNVITGNLDLIERSIAVKSHMFGKSKYWKPISNSIPKNEVKISGYVNNTPFEVITSDPETCGLIIKWFDAVNPNFDSKTLWDLINEKFNPSKK